MADHAEDKDVPMEAQDVEVTEKVDAEVELPTAEDASETVNTDKTDIKTEEEEADPYDDSGAASEVEFGAEDDRTGQTEQDCWTWHIEVYPLSPEDTTLDNFVKLVTTAEQSNVVFRTTESGEKRGEAHFYTNDFQGAKVLIRTICCRKFSVIRPFVYVYYRHEDGNVESAVLRLDLIEAAKMRWDRQRKNVGKWDPSTRVAKVSDVPLNTTKEFLNIVFARAFHIKRESDESEEAAKKASEAEAKAKETNNEEDKEDEDKDESNEEDDDELVGEFNGNLTIDCVSRTSLKGFLLGYRKVTIGSNVLSIKALSTKDFDMDELRKEVRKKRAEEAKQMAVKSGKGDDSRNMGRGGNKDSRGGVRGGRGVRGGTPRGGRGDYRGSGRGGIMTGRQKMEEKMRRGGAGGMRGGSRDVRGGGRDMRGAGRDMWGGGPRDMRGGGRGGYGARDDMQYQMAMNTYRLERQMISMRGRGRGGYGLMGSGGYRDYHPDPYEMSAMSPRGYSDYDPRDDWGYRSPPMHRYSDEMGLGRLPMRGLRGRRL